ncbi:MAG: hypothetical protein KatS3mg124_0578 [Porticoccaceae bacterium]|nr:MAG: hypothetical protein KatS3mg124_0578 [Porticoccaceae bacterium]
MSRQLVLALLLLLAVAVIAVLPRYVREPLIPAAELAAPTPPPAEAVPRSVDLAAARRARQAALALVESLLAQRAALEARGAASWGGARWRAAQAAFAEGEAHYAQGAYARALEAYQRAEGLFDELAAEAEREAEAARAALLTALEEGRVAEATEALARLRRVDPEEPRLDAWAQRVVNLPEVVSLLAEGEALAGRSDWAGAVAALERAVALDPEHRRAAERLAAARAARAEAEVRERLGEGYAALARGDLAAADVHFRRAAALRPGAAEVERALEALAARRQRVRLEARLRAAAEREAAEDWAAAADLYAALAEEDPTLVEPRVRLVVARARAALDRDLESLLADPLALSRPEVAERAERVLADARALPAPGPRLAGQIAALERLLAAARRRVPVALVSDGATEVTIWRVARLGTFERRVVELQPGRYVAAGARPGYRDVQVPFTVPLEGDPPAVAVRCVEPL